MAYNLAATLSVNITQFSQGMQNAAGHLNQLSQSVNNVDSNTSGLSGTLKTLGGAIAGYFAVDKIKSFTTGMVEAAAEAQAMAAQFDQVFGADAGEARGVIENLGKDFGMVSNRIKPAMTQMTSMFKGLGLETGEAMDQAMSAVTLVADAAAFYDKSFEDANASLNSFIKGNYEGGESIGLFANETQLAAWASKNLSVDWKKLNEAGKQTARLQFAQSMQEAAGATGQAARESNSYSNQLGNLKQTWTDTMALLGEPLLEPAINGLKSLAERLREVDTGRIISGFQTFGSYMSETFMPVLNDFKSIGQSMWTGFTNIGGLDAMKLVLEGIKTGLSWIKDNSVVITAGVLGLVGALATFKTLTTISAAIGVFNTLLAAFRTGTLMATLAQYGLNTAMLANPIAWVAVAIGALIAIGVLLWKNWDTVKEKAQALWEVTKFVFGKIYEWGSQKIQPVVDFFKRLADKFNDFKSAITNFKMPEWVSSIGGKISGAVGKVRGFLDGSHSGGLSYVPKNNYVANLHRGEAVLTKSEADQWRNGRGGNTVQFGDIHINGGSTTAETVDELMREIARRVDATGGLM
ncbi:hypothetical protein [Cytobacillus oceanisediminis]|uniref:Phage tail tape measure protein n=1 Tax=Cytobacillus oceanisediminis 2691 TaxID=1196031 RepID=A0A169FM05_9BACI|nr:hypothetical protein [Cytobacillus oceanisediminis]AND39621.1 hypothetical protein A361_10890 [Cytobacillus oceanisediminis 2691]